MRSRDVDQRTEAVDARARGKLLPMSPDQRALLSALAAAPAERAQSVAALLGALAGTDARARVIQSVLGEPSPRWAVAWLRDRGAWGLRATASTRDIELLMRGQSEGEWTGVVRVGRDVTAVGDVAAESVEEEALELTAGLWVSHALTTLVSQETHADGSRFAASH